MSPRTHTSGFQVSHGERALQARRHPDQWTYIRSYEHPDTAEQALRAIRDGRYAAYQPPGRYQARLVQEPNLWPHRPWVVYARYTSQEA